MWKDHLLAPERPAHKQEAQLFLLHTPASHVSWRTGILKGKPELSPALCAHLLVLNSPIMYSSHLTIPDRPLPKPLQSPEGELVLNWILWFYSGRIVTQALPVLAEQLFRLSGNRQEPGILRSPRGWLLTQRLPLAPSSYRAMGLAGSPYTISGRWQGSQIPASAGHAITDTLSLPHYWLPPPKGTSSRLGEHTRAGLQGLLTRGLKMGLKKFKLDSRGKKKPLLEWSGIGLGCPGRCWSHPGGVQEASGPDAGWCRLEI